MKSFFMVLFYLTFAVSVFWPSKAGTGVCAMLFWAVMYFIERLDEIEDRRNGGT